jgi:hypothetical protein
LRFAKYQYANPATLARTATPTPTAIPNSRRNLDIGNRPGVESQIGYLCLDTREPAEFRLIRGDVRLPSTVRFVSFTGKRKLGVYAS